MVSSSLPLRLQWVARTLDVSPDDELLEIGCGTGVSVSLVCDRLAGGRITAIDRSAVAIERATRRNAANVAAGKAVFRQADLAGLELGGQRFDTVFAINVNLFWVRPAGAELRRIQDLLRPDGVLHLVYGLPGGKAGGEPDRAAVDRVVAAVTGGLAEHGFAPVVRTDGPPSLLWFTATPDGSAAGRRQPG